MSLLFKKTPLCCLLCILCIMKALMTVLGTSFSQLQSHMLNVRLKFHLTFFTTSILHGLWCYKRKRIRNCSRHVRSDSLRYWNVVYGTSMKQRIKTHEKKNCCDHCSALETILRVSLPTNKYQNYFEDIMIYDPRVILCASLITWYSYDNSLDLLDYLTSIWLEVFYYCTQEKGWKQKTSCGD